MRYKIVKDEIVVGYARTAEDAAEFIGCVRELVHRAIKEDRPVKGCRIYKLEEGEEILPIENKLDKMPAQLKYELVKDNVSFGKYENMAQVIEIVGASEVAIWKQYRKNRPCKGYLLKKLLD